MYIVFRKSVHSVFEKMFSQLDIRTNLNLTLHELSMAKAERLVPSIVYLIVLSVCGTTGNGLVLLIFYRKFRSSIHRCFILTLAAFDFCACSIGAPWAIAETLNVFSYTDVISCKLFRFCLYYFSVSSSLTLVLIAIERHRKICRPLKRQLSVPLAKRALFLVAGVFSFLSCVPVFFLYGQSTIHTQIGNLTGTRCFITDDMYQTVWPATFNVYLLILATVSTFIMTACYFRVARRVSILGNENVQKRTMKASEKSTTSRSSLDNVEPEAGSDPVWMATYHPSPNTTPIVIRKKHGVTVKTKQLASKLVRSLSGKSSHKTLRITKMLIMVTTVFVISYLPHLLLMLWSTIAGLNADIDPTYPRDNTYQVLFYSFLINNIINPIIYGIMDLKFREECKKAICCTYCKKI